jgi:hypothetical protein
VFYYGGGWGGKVTWGGENFKVLVDNGYVAAMPDYVLGAQQPVPLAVWDGAAAIRFLRANAAKYRIDPERIAAVGLSAGGWLVQYMAPSDSATIWQQGRKGEPQSFIPMLEPHPANAGYSARVCALVTDWGAGKLKGSNPDPKIWLGPDDPPMFTCVTIPETTLTAGVKAYREAGAVTEIAHTYTKSPAGEPVGGKNPGDYGHCLVGVAVDKTFTKDKTGKEVTFGARTLQFLDEYVKSPKTASAPEMFPQGGPVFGDVSVVMRTVHAGAKIHYSLAPSSSAGADSAAASGGEFWKSWRVYEKPVTAKGGVTLKAIVVKTGLQPSPVATAVFTAATCAPPVITTAQQVYRAKAKEPFSVKFEAKSDRPVTWGLSGKIEAKALEAVDTNKDSSKIKREAPRLTLDPKTGVLSGTPGGPGVSVFIMAANVADGQTALCDARSVIVVAE